MEARIHAQTRFAFRQSMQAACHRTRVLSQLLTVSFRSNPTHMAREVLNNSNRFASVVGDSLSVWPCTVVSEYTLLPMNSTCTLEIPIQFSLYGKVHHGYLSPSTSTLSLTDLLHKLARLSSRFQSI